MSTLKYDVESKSYTELKSLVVAPKFQRNFVWRKKARKELINSIKNGLPIGSFLLQNLPNGKYNIIDGRQRFSTLLDYEKHRYDYVEETDISEDKVLELINSVGEVKNRFDKFNESAKKAIIKNIKQESLKQLKTKDASNEDVKYEIREIIEKEFPGLDKNTKKQLANAIDVFHQKIWMILDTSNIKLPCIIFKTDVNDDVIVSTFINLNTKGTKLSKYDLYSASWQNDYIMVNDNVVIEKVIAKYKDSLEANQNIETEDFNEEEIIRTCKINVFEYAYALSKLIGEKCGNKIYQIKEASEVDSLGFSVLASILGVECKKMVDLAEKLIKSRLNLVELKNKIIDCTLKVQKHLEWYCTSPDGKILFTHTLNQLVSYIVTVFKGMYEITADGRIVDNAKKSKLNDFFNNLPLWYLYDNIRDFWTGSGDLKSDDLVLIDDIFSSRYFGKVSKESFRMSMDEWLSGENEEKNSTIKPEVKLFINYLIKKQCNEPHISMDFEHIIPQSRLTLLSTREKGVLGISSPANLTLIPSFDNRSKREKTYYELIASKDQTALSYNKELLSKYIYPEHHEIEFIESQNSFNVQAYNDFKKERTNTLINLFFRLYY